MCSSEDQSRGKPEWEGRLRPGHHEVKAKLDV